MRIVMIFLGLAACASEPGTKAETHPSESRRPIAARPDSRAPLRGAARPGEALDPRFAAMIETAAAPYRSWGRVDEQPNVAPMMCDMPRPQHYGSQGRVHISEREDAPHGKKLYYLWASDRDGYRNLASSPVKPGFAIVKEAFAAKPISAARTEVQPIGDKPPLHDKLKVGDGWLTTGEAKGLYVMAKVGGDGTDEGWIYGTIAPGGEVTSAGRVASCIGCHEDAPHDRLFGPKQHETHGY